jgi:hypothetical protein
MIIMIVINLLYPHQSKRSERKAFKTCWPKLFYFFDALKFPLGCINVTPVTFSLPATSN